MQAQLSFSKGIPLLVSDKVTIVTSDNANSFNLTRDHFKHARYCTVWVVAFGW